ncbi:MAG: RluA family pseudouridine synthase [Alkalispirochaeta sp.]
MSRLVYLDSSVLVIDKSSGEAVAGRRADQKSLAHYWRTFLREPRLQPVHRIDQPVAGLVVWARTAEVFSRLHGHLQDGHMTREYIAVVDTPPSPQSGTLNDRIAVDKSGNRSRIDPAGKQSELTYETIGSTQHHTILLIRLRTGRHHQIRAQLGHRGWHVVGDTKYGARRPLRDGGIALLAYTVKFPHPVHPVEIPCRARFPQTSLWQAVSSAVIGDVDLDRFEQ